MSSPQHQHCKSNAGEIRIYTHAYETTSTLTLVCKLNRFLSSRVRVYYTHNQSDLIAVLNYKCKERRAQTRAWRQKQSKSRKTWGAVFFLRLASRISSPPITMGTSVVVDAHLASASSSSARSGVPAAYDTCTTSIKAVLNTRTCDIVVYQKYEYKYIRVYHTCVVQTEIAGLCYFKMTLCEQILIVIKLMPLLPFNRKSNKTQNLHSSLL